MLKTTTMANEEIKEIEKTFFLGIFKLENKKIMFINVIYQISTNFLLAHIFLALK